MKKLLFLAAMAIVLVTSGCKKSGSVIATNREDFVGTYYLASNGKWEIEGDSIIDEKYRIVAIVDTINISVDPDSEDGMIVTGKVIKGTATVTSQGFKMNTFVYEKEGAGIGYSYSLNLNITNDYATYLAGIMTWNSTFEGTASVSTIGAGAAQKVTGTLSTKCIYKAI